MTAAMTKAIIDGKNPHQHDLKVRHMDFEFSDDIPELALFPEVHFMQKPFSAEIFLSKLAVKS